MHRLIAPIRISDRTARGMGLVVSNGVRGNLSWRSWLQQQLGAKDRAA